MLTEFEEPEPAKVICHVGADGKMICYVFHGDEGLINFNSYEVDFSTFN